MEKQKYTIETIDRQWTVEGPMDETRIIHRWITGYAHNTGALDHAIFDEKGVRYEVVFGVLEEHWAN